MKILATGLLLCGMLCGTAQADFSGDYVLGNWIIGGGGNNFGSVVLNGPLDVTLISNSTGNNNTNQDFTFVAIEDATISFDWSFTTVDTGTSTTNGAQWDPFGYLLAGTFSQLSDNTGVNNTGNATFAVTVGEVFGFRTNTVDGIFGSSTTTVSNFFVTPSVPAVVPLPPSAALMACALGGLVLVQRRRKQYPRVNFATA